MLIWRNFEFFEVRILVVVYFQLLKASLKLRKGEFGWSMFFRWTNKRFIFSVKKKENKYSYFKIWNFVKLVKSPYNIHTTLFFVCFFVFDRAAYLEQLVIWSRFALLFCMKKLQNSFFHLGFFFLILWLKKTSHQITKFTRYCISFCKSVSCNQQKDNIIIEKKNFIVSFSKNNIKKLLVLHKWYNQKQNRQFSHFSK